MDGFGDDWIHLWVWALENGRELDVPPYSVHYAGLERSDDDREEGSWVPPRDRRSSRGSSGGVES